MEFSIKSNQSDRALVFSNFNGDHFDVEIRGMSLNAQTRVYLYTFATELQNLFQELASLSKPWVGEREWGSIEDDFCLVLTCDKLGNVSIKIKLALLQGYNESSTIYTVIYTDFGLLNSINRELKLFFGRI